MSFKRKPAPSVEERNKMAIAFMESAVYRGTDFDRDLVSLIRKGLILFEQPDWFEITKEGQEQVENRDA